MMKNIKKIVLGLLVIVLLSVSDVFAGAPIKYDDSMGSNSKLKCVYTKPGDNTKNFTVEITADFSSSTSATWKISTTGTGIKTYSFNELIYNKCGTTSPRNNIDYDCMLKMGFSMNENYEENSNAYVGCPSNAYVNSSNNELVEFSHSYNYQSISSASNYKLDTENSSVTASKISYLRPTSSNEIFKCKVSFFTGNNYSECEKATFDLLFYLKENSDGSVVPVVKNSSNNDNPVFRVGERKFYVTLETVNSHFKSFYPSENDKSKYRAFNGYRYFTSIIDEKSLIKNANGDITGIKKDSNGYSNCQSIFMFHPGYTTGVSITSTMYRLLLPSTIMFDDEYSKLVSYGGSFHCGYNEIENTDSKNFFQWFSTSLFDSKKEVSNVCRYSRSTDYHNNCFSFFGGDNVPDSDFGFTGNGFGCDSLSDGLIEGLKNIVTLAKIIAPLLLIALGSFDFAKAVISGDKDANSKAVKNFIKRCLAALLIFFLPFLINLFLKLVNIILETDLSLCGIAKVVFRI